jgi:hypothetical protein
LDVFKDPNVVMTIKPSATSGTYMFRNTKWTGNEAFPPNNLTIDLSVCTSTNYFFQNSDISHIGTLNLTKVTSSLQMFYGYSNLVQIDKLIFSNTKSPAIASAVFNGAKKLKTLTIEGSITQTFHIANCVELDRSSILSIL